MGEVFASFEISIPGTSAPGVTVEGIVDTGATLSLVPAETLDRLGVRRIERIQLDLADGTLLERDLGHVMIRIGKRSAPASVVFGEAGDATLLGVTALEQLGLTVDPVHRRLIPTSYKLYAARKTG